MLNIESEPVGEGRERACYVHPEDPRRAVKVPTGKNTEQTRREVRFYRDLKKRGLDDNPHIPKFYGMSETSVGPGMVVEMIRNYDGEIARPMNWYLAQGVPIEEFDSYLEELKQSFLDNLIIFNHDLTIGNLLLQKTSLSKARLVVIDGLGDTVAIPWLNRFPFLVRRKIRRRWARFKAHIYRTREVRAQLDAARAEATGGD